MGNVPMMDVPAMAAKARELSEQARAILTNPESSVEDKGKVQGLLDEAKGFQAQAIQMKHLEELQGGLTQFANPANGGGSQQADTAQTAGVETYDANYKPDGSNFKTTEGFVRALLKATPRRDGMPPVRSKNLRWFDATRDDGIPEQKDMIEGVGAAGGFLVPPDFFTNILSVQQQLVSIIRPRATVIRMRRREVRIPVLDQTSTTSGRPHWFGGLRAFWTEEAGLKATSDAAWRQITLVAHKLTAFTRASDELLDDAAVSLTDFLMGPMGFPGAIAWMEEDAFWNGTGAGQPQGILNSPARITVNREDQDNITYTDLVNMITKFMPSAGGIWVASQAAIGKLLLMTGPAGNPSYIWGPGAWNANGGGITNAVPGMLLGRPLFISEHLPATSTTSAGDLVLVDPSYYLIGDRQATTLASTIYENFQYDQTSFRAVHRVDGQGWLASPLTLSDGSTTYSPFVVLGAKST